LRQILEERNATVVRTFETSAELSVSETELLTAFTNVIRNALEHLPMGGRIAIRVFRGRNWRTGSEGVKVLIADNGPGISPDVVRQLFQPFVSTKPERGAGLGLWTARAITVKYGGEVHIRTSVVTGRSGTSVSMFFPAAKKALGKKRLRNSKRPNDTSMQCLP